MLFTVFLKGAYAFTVFLEELTALYFISSCFFQKRSMHSCFEEFVGPLFIPFRKLQKKSVLQCRVDFSCLIVILILLFLQGLLT